MDKNEAKEKLSKYLAGDLSEAEASELIIYLQEQGKDPAALELLKRMGSSDQPLPSPEPSPYIKTRLQARLKRSEAKKKSSLFSLIYRPVKVPSFILIILLVILIALTINTVRLSTTEPQPVQENFYLAEESEVYDYYYDYETSSDDTSFYQAFSDTLTSN